MTEQPGVGHATRLDSITGLRWWAAFVVFGYHMLVFAPLPASAASLLQFGHFGVTFFFVLSGFVLTWSMRPGTTKATFYWRRFARIYPLSLVTLLLAIPVFYSFHPDPADWWVKPVSIGILLLSVVLLQGWSRDPAILFSGNPAAWTLTVEMFFYAVHPFIAPVVARFSKRGALWAAGGVIAFAVLTRIATLLAPTGWIAGLPWPILRLNEFVLGICIAWAFRLGWRPKLHPVIPLVGLLVYFLVVADTPGIDAIDQPLEVVITPYASEVVTVLCAALIIATASRELRGRAGWTASKPLVALGEWSFAFYLVHATIIYVALEVFGLQPARWANLAWFAVLLVVATAAAAALHLGVEKPLETRLRRWQQAKSSARAEKKSAAVGG
ncbi:acyltransferase family protein [Agromyces atrinae]|uniref:Peptidoglycan/LPS O-acetylase OafA/YrhL n=1 Tax=Agromyces atrinae TaxID=592376 RepID=A0A852SDF9_9MICO|nr:acyltransferase [Agromyces atrinae]NYD66690.1 peptidoglycan/LPS O-acetylase OafA/YrhL [Agromyces atrinae]